MDKRAGTKRNTSVPLELIPAEQGQLIDAQFAFQDTAAHIVKLSKKYEEALVDLNKARLKLSDELLSMPLFLARKKEMTPERQHFDERLDHFRQSTRFLVKCGQTFEQDFRQTVHEPLRKYAKMSAGVQNGIRHHEKTALEFVKARDKHEKLLKSSSGDTAKRDKAASHMFQAKKKWEQQENSFPEELAELLAAHRSFVEPSLQSWSAALHNFLDASIETLTVVCHEKEATMSPAQYADEIEVIFDHLNKLEITEHVSTT